MDARLLFNAGEQFFRFIMAKTSYILMRWWWWCSSYTRPTRLYLDFYSANPVRG